MSAGPPPVTAVQKVGRKDYATYREVVELLDDAARVADLKAMLGSERALERFRSVALHAIATNSTLLTDCSAISIVQAVKDAATLDLEPTGLNGEGAIIPYKGQAKFQPMWRGLLKLARRSDEILAADCQVVYMNDRFELELGTHPGIKHVPILVGEKDAEDKPLAERGDYRGIYAWALLRTGIYIIEWMTADEINYVRDRFGQTGKPDSPWRTSWSEMGRKTVLKRLTKRLPSSATDMRLEKALALDNEALEAEATLVAPTPAVSAARAAARSALGLESGGDGKTGEEAAPSSSEGEAMALGPSPVASEQTPHDG